MIFKNSINSCPIHKYLGRYIQNKWYRPNRIHEARASSSLLKPTTFGKLMKILMETNEPLFESITSVRMNNKLVGRFSLQRSKAQTNYY